MPSETHSPSSLKPFLIEIRQDRKQPNGSFVPVASLKLTESFRESGLWYALPAEDMKSLICLLTFITPEGHCSVSQPILASSMKTSSNKVKARMHRLAGFRWKGEPLIIELSHESGIFTYGLHPSVVGYEHLTISEAFPSSPLRSLKREEVIAYSRATYARPRAEVEKQIAQQLGQDITETEEERKLRFRLENVGLTSEQARDTVNMFSADVIAQQLDWLPYRHAKNPAGYLLAAIEGGYGEPRGIREQRLALEQENLESRAESNSMTAPSAQTQIMGEATVDDAMSGSLNAIEITGEIGSLREDGQSVDLYAGE